MVDKKNIPAMRSIVALLCISFSLYAADTLSTWQYTAAITLNTSATGANVATTQKNFPVLIRLTSLNAAPVFATAMTNGGDLRFSHAGDTGQLPFELIRYDAVNERAVIWVKADSVQGNNASQTIRMWWGKNGAATTSNPAAVFATANGFDAVWHLNSSTGTVSNYTFNDATANGYALTGSGTTGTVDSPAVIDSGRAFNTVTPSGKDSLWFNGWVGSPAHVTMSAWVKIDSIDYAGGAVKSSTIISIGNSVGDEFYENGTTGLDSLQTAWNTGATSWSKLITTHNLGNLKHQWVYFVAVDAPGGGGQALYLNGLLINSSTNTSAINYATSNYRSTFTELGWSTGAGQTEGKFFGTMCEARIDTGARPADWIKLCFENQQAADSLTKVSVLSNAGIPALLSPSNGAGNQPTSLSLTWGSVSGATSYGVQASTDVNFGSTVLQQSGLAVTTQSLTGLTAGTTYYWRANATGSSGTGPWSSAWSFVTAIPAPGAPTPLSPTNGAPNVPVNVSLSWSTVSTASSYQAQVSTDAGFGTTAFSQSSLTSTFTSASGLANSTTYYWRAGAANAGGNGPWSVAWSFGTIYGTVGIPVLSSPASGTSNLPLTVTLSWGATSSASTYNVQVSTTSTFVPTIYSLNSLINTSTTISSLNPNTTYYWRVDGTNTGGSGTWSAIWNFTTTGTEVLHAGDLHTLKTDFAVKGNTLEYSLESTDPVEIGFSDLLGRIALVVNRTQSAGHYAIELKNCNLAAGHYIVSFKAAGIERQASIVITR